MLSKPRSTEAYRAIFDCERLSRYPAVERIEQRLGYAIDLDRLDVAARVLACPLKRNSPHWAHGRVLYAVARRYLEDVDSAFFLDIGTAKGFSALCLRWASIDAGKPVRIVSVDVLDPDAREYRNTVAEVDGPKLLCEILAPWPEARGIEFRCDTGASWMLRNPERIHLAFVDGRHSYDAVSTEAALLAERQRPGDIAIFDDVHVPGVEKAVRERRDYSFERIDALPNRAYAICVKR